MGIGGDRGEDVPWTYDVQGWGEVLRRLFLRRRLKHFLQPNYLTGPLIIRALNSEFISCSFPLFSTFYLPLIKLFSGIFLSLLVDLIEY